MKILLTTLNSKYIHSNLALRLLKSHAESRTVADIDLREFTINQNLDTILMEMDAEKYDLIGFSVYIWNKEQTFRIIEDIRKSYPKVKILLGGPEVSFSYMEDLPCNYLIRGEGEEAFVKLIQHISGVEGFLTNEYNTVFDLDKIEYPFDLISDDKITYYESKRGCPYNCSYCLSSASSGVRYKSIDIVKNEIASFVKLEIPLVKFIDRTFNIKADRTIELLEYMKSIDAGKTTFHFEISPNLITEEFIDTVKVSRKDLFQFEIGIQSTFDTVNEAVDRHMKYNAYSGILSKFISEVPSHTHVDLIIGLPLQTLDMAKESFNKVYSLKADEFQLGFLKVIKGTRLSKDAEKYGIIHRSYQPYEVLKTNDMSTGDVLQMKGVESALEHLYNKGFTKQSVEWVISEAGNPFEFFNGFALYLKKADQLTSSLSRDNVFRHFSYYVKSEHENLYSKFLELLKLDYLSGSRFKTIGIFEEENTSKLKTLAHGLLQNDDFVAEFLPERKGEIAKSLIKDIHFHFTKLSPGLELDETMNVCMVHDKGILILEDKTIQKYLGD